MSPLGKDYIEELWVSINGDMKGLRNSLNRSKGDINKFLGEIKGMSTQLDSVGRDVTKVSIALVGLGAISLKVFADFQQAMANTQSVIGATGEELIQLTGFAREMGKTTIFTATQSAEAMYFLASAGFDTKQTIDSLQSTLELAAATQFNLAETTRIVVSTMNQFGIAAEDAGRVSNTFAAVISSSQATMDRLGESLKFVGPIAKSLKLPFEQITAAMGLLFNTGLQASQAGTNMRQALIRLQKPTRAARSAIEELGLSFRKINPQFNDLIDIIGEFERAGAGAATAGDELAEIFGARAVTAFQALIRQGTPALKAMQERITGTSKATTMARIQIDTFKGSLRLLLSVLQEAAIQIGETVAPLMREVADVARDLINLFNNMSPELKKVIIGAAGFAGALGLIVGPLFMIISRLPQFIIGINSLGLVMATFGGVVSGVILGLGALAAAIIYFAGKERRAKKDTEDNIIAIKELIDTQKDAATQARNLATEYLGLANNSDTSAEKQEKMRRIADALNQIYPGLIDKTGDYADQIIEVRNALVKANYELERLSKLQRQIAEIKLTLQLLDVDKQLEELREQIAETGDFIDEALTTEFVIGGFNAERVLQTFNDIAEAIGKAEAKSGKIRSSMLEIEGVAKKLVTTEEGRAKLINDIAAADFRIKTIQAKILEQKNNIALAGRDAYRQELATRNIALKELDGYTAIRDVYASTLKIGLELLTLEEERRKTIEAIKLIGQEIPETPEEPEPTDGRKRSQAEIDAEAKLQALLRGLREESMKAWLNRQRMMMEEDFDERKNLELEKFDERRKLSLLEFDLNKQLLERELKDTQDKAAKIIQKKKEALDEQELTEIEYSKAIAEIDAETVEARISVAKEFNQRFLELETKRNEEIKDIDKDQEEYEQDRKERQLKFESEQNEIGLENYKEYLEAQLEATQKYSDRWYEIQKEITKLEEDEFKKRLRNARLVGRAIADSLKTFGKAAAEGAQGITDAWKKALKRVIDMFAETYIKILEADIVLGIATLDFGKIARAGIGIAGISAIQGIAKGAIDRAQIGADIVRSGAINVHAGETIVPAAVVRRPNDFYERRLEETKPSIASGSDDDVILAGLERPTFILQNPLVDSQEYWDNIIMEYYPEAVRRLKKRIGER